MATSLAVIFLKRFSMQMRTVIGESPMEIKKNSIPTVSTSDGSKGLLHIIGLLFKQRIVSFLYDINFTAIQINSE